MTEMLQTLEGVAHTLCSLKDKSLKKLGLIYVAKKLYIKYREIKVGIFQSETIIGLEANSS